ncbi:MAG TPA: TonB family protein [Thermoanaerobaculia bacterium]|nr:TonB family protein [Thermoanaerobaculia bacterium]
MFETSVVPVHAEAARGRFSLLTVSVIAHTAVVVGAIAVSIASIDFPSHAPDAFAHAPEFIRIQVPPPLGDPNGGARRAEPAPAKQQQPNVTPPPVRPDQATAPAAIPEETTTSTTDLPAVSAGDGGGDSHIPGATSTADRGVPWGTENSTGPLDAPPGPATNAQPVEEKIYELHEVKAPVLLRRVDPPYPPRLVSTRMRATVVVRCVIDKNGRVRDPQVIVPATLAPFNATVVEHVQQWRYTPGSRNGVAVETYLNVTVTFGVN